MVEQTPLPIVRIGNPYAPRSPKYVSTIRHLHINKAVTDENMNSPSHFLRLPKIEHTSEEIDGFERLYGDQIQGARGSLVDYRLTTPKWHFLNYLGESKDVVFHGSSASEIGDRTRNASIPDEGVDYQFNNGCWVTITNNEVANLAYFS